MRWYEEDCHIFLVIFFASQNKEQPCRLIQSILVAVLLKKEILFILIGGVFVIESFSVIIQVIFFKIIKIKNGQGKRFFKMAPLHHHFELQGWPETHIVIRFWIIGIILALISLTSFKIQ